ncbi:MAG: HPF/RaiA family ribosome-associated protein [Acidobacteria bacterium]|nr:HPF/RaiA family ribosome-associated protein [Acidobacteriota bacterium]
MTFTITGRHLKVSEPARTEIRQKMRALERVLNDNAVSATCVLLQERQMVVCELSVHARGGHRLHAVGRHALVVGAAAAAVDKLVPQARRLTERWKAKRRDRTAQPVAEKPAPEPALPPVTVPKVVRSRGYTARPLTVADAALELASSQAPVLVFRHATSDSLAVLFRRADGAFGLIETTGV